MSIYEIMAQPDSEVKVVHVAVTKTKTPELNRWLLLSGNVHHGTGTTTRVLFRTKKDNYVFFSFTVASTVASGNIPMTIEGIVLLGVSDEIYMTGDAASQGVNLKVLEFIPTLIKEKDHRRGWWKHL